MVVAICWAIRPSGRNKGKIFVSYHWFISVARLLFLVSFDRQEKMKYIHARAYITFRHEDALYAFKKAVHGKILPVFDHAKGSAAIGNTTVEVEYAPHQSSNITVYSFQTKRQDPLEGSYENDETFKSFMESLKRAEATAKEEKKPLPVSRVDDAPDERPRQIVETPLVKALLNKKQADRAKGKGKEKDKKSKGRRVVMETTSFAAPITIKRRPITDNETNDDRDDAGYAADSINAADATAKSRTRGGRQERRERVVKTRDKPTEIDRKDSANGDDAEPGDGDAQARRGARVGKSRLFASALSASASVVDPAAAKSSAFKSYSFTPTPAAPSPADVPVIQPMPPPPRYEKPEPVQPPQPRVQHRAQNDFNKSIDDAFKDVAMSMSMGLTLDMPDGQLESTPLSMALSDASYHNSDASKSNMRTSSDKEVSRKSIGVIGSEVKTMQRSYDPVVAPPAVEKQQKYTATPFDEHTNTTAPVDDDSVQKAAGKTHQRRQHKADKRPTPAPFTVWTPGQT